MSLAARFLRAGRFGRPVSPESASRPRAPDALHKNVARRPGLRRRIARHWAPTGGVRLNLGCGGDYREGWINLDRSPEVADIGHDLSEVPWPFDDASIDWVFADQVFEHLPPMTDGRDTVLQALEEIQRILRPGGRMYVGVPYGGSKADFAHIGHYRHFSTNSFKFLEDGGTNRPYTRKRFKGLRLRYKATVRELPLLRLPFNVGKPEELIFIIEKRADADA